MSVPIDAKRPSVNLTPGKREGNADVQDFTVPVFRERGRGGRQFLRLAVAGFADRADQRNPIDGPAGKAGSVLVIEFTLAGQGYMALNGGTRFEYTPAISFKIDCNDQAEVDRLWNALSSNGGSEVRCGWVRDRYGVSWQIVPSVMPQLLGGPDRAGSERAMRAMMGMIKLDIAALQKAYDGG
jgi:predicted 3-demethylubiquinone-9 3-methyltransferase (glyoxalase superfamily)